MGPAKNPQDVANTLVILFLLTILSLAPAILILTTPFLRISIVLSMLRSALARGRATMIHHRLDEGRMAEAAAYLIGEHDFSAFRAAECQSRTPVRRLEELAVERRGEWIIVRATANT